MHRHDSRDGRGTLYEQKEQYAKRIREEQNQVRKEERRRRRHGRAKILLTAIISAGLGGGGVYLWFMLGQPPGTSSVAVRDNEADVSLVPVRFGSLNAMVEADGATAPLSSSDLGTRVSGVVMETRAKEGDAVKKGDVLFTIVSADYYAKVRQSEEQVKTAAEVLTNAQKSFQEAYEAYESAYNATWTTGAWESFDFSLEERAKSAYAEVDKAQQALDAAQASHDAFMAAGTQDFTQGIQAPISGNVMRMAVTPGMEVTLGADDDGEDPLVNIVDISQMVVTVQVSDADITRVKPNQPATVTFSAMPGTEFSGTVQRIEDIVADAPDDDGQATGGRPTIHVVTISVADLSPQLKMGMPATAKIEVETAKEAEENHPIVPKGAIQEDEKGQAFVTVQNKDGQMGNVPVKVLGMSPIEVAVEGELEEGDLVATRGQEAPGMGEMGAEPDGEPKTDGTADESEEPEEPSPAKAEGASAGESSGSAPDGSE